jgi:hypothetical protein
MSEITNEDIDSYINRITRENGGVDPTRTFTTQMYYDGRFRNQLRVIDINNRIVDLYNPETAQVLGRAVLDSVNCITLEQDMTDFNNFCIDHLSRLAVLTHTVQEEERKVSFFLSHVVHFNVYFRLDGIWIPPLAQTAHISTLYNTLQSLHTRISCLESNIESNLESNIESNVESNHHPQPTDPFHTHYTPNHISGRRQKKISKYFLSVNAPESASPHIIEIYITGIFNEANKMAGIFQNILRSRGQFVPEYNILLPENYKKMVTLYIRHLIVKQWQDIEFICNYDIPLLISIIEGFDDPNPKLEKKYFNKIIADQIRFAYNAFYVEMRYYTTEKSEEIQRDAIKQFYTLQDTQRESHTPFDRDDAFKPINMSTSY